MPPRKRWKLFYGSGKSGAGFEVCTMEAQDMIPAGDWIGKTVVSAEHGKELGEVEDLVFEEGSLSCLVIAPALPWGKKRHIPSSSILSDGEEIIVVSEGEEEPGEWEKVPDPARVLTLRQGSTSLLGKPAMRADGVRLGVVSDVYIGDQWETIVGYELSQGIVRDLVEGRKFLPASLLERVGEDWILFRTGESM
jgi:uncharacterized protein YrrD